MRLAEDLASDTSVGFCSLLHAYPNNSYACKHGDCACLCRTHSRSVLSQRPEIVHNIVTGSAKVREGCWNRSKLTRQKCDCSWHVAASGMHRASSVTLRTIEAMLNAEIWCLLGHFRTGLQPSMRKQSPGHPVHATRNFVASCTLLRQQSLRGGMRAQK